MFSFLFRSLIFNAFIDLYCTLQLLLLNSNAQHDNNEGRFVLMQMCVARTFITDNTKNVQFTTNIQYNPHFFSFACMHFVHFNVQIYNLMFILLYPFTYPTQTQTYIIVCTLLCGTYLK